MKKRIKALIPALIILAAFASGYVATFFIKNNALKKEKNEYYIYASCYPVYALSSLIIKDVPGMRLNMLTQPQEDGYTQYALSDWERAILAQGDAVIFMGSGFEYFAEAYSSGKTAVVTLLGMAELKTIPENCRVLNFTDSEKAVEKEYSPWLYMSVDGAIELCETICANMAYLDQEYSSLYYENLYGAYDILSVLEAQKSALNMFGGTKIAVAHEALIHTAYDLNMDISIYINRETAQELDQDEINACIGAMRESDVKILLIEQQADSAMIKAFEAAGITVIRINLMLDMPQSFGYEGYIQAYRDNLEAVREALIK